MRTIVIGDVHGNYKKLRELLNGLRSENIYNPSEDKMIFLGDYIDRGENPRITIETIRNLQMENPNVIALKGNHEDMAVKYMENLNTENSSPWPFNGYENTLYSYESHEDQLLNDLLWMENLPLYHEDDNYIYVHGGINKKLPMEYQKPFDILWSREEFYYDTTPYGKIVIFGHTPVEFLGNHDNTPVFLNGNIAIDTGCFYTGVLTALIIEDGKIKGYCQTQKGSNKMIKTELSDNYLFSICIQGFYGNRNTISIKEKDIDNILEGIIDAKVCEPWFPNDRKEILIPDTDNLYVVYNYSLEKDELSLKENARNKGVILRPLITIPCIDLELYSTCFVCKKDSDGNYINLEDDDYPKFIDYLSE